MNFIPENISIDFMGKRKKAFLLSGALVGGSLILIIAMGLNLGIDFKGGSSAIVAFDANQEADRAAIEQSIAQLVADEMGDAGTYVSVQDFDTGVASETDGKPTQRFLVYTEITSLITDAKRVEIRDALLAKFGEKTGITLPGEGVDVFNLTFEEEVDVLGRYDELKAAFAEMGYDNVSVESDAERQELVQFYEGLELELSERREAVEGQPTKLIQTQESFEAELPQRLQDKKDKRFSVRVEEFKAKLNEKLAADFPQKFVDVESSTSVSPSVGADLLANGLLAILYAIIGILIYITLRFDFRYAPGAVVALVHDVLITLGIFALLQVKFSLPIIAALLTIVGYSLNDTIVVLDRVRETFDAYRGRDITELLNRAVNNTLSRTTLTSLTTLLVVIMILVFGGGLIQDFALALLIGIIVGTYSSIFVASPLVLYMDAYLNRREAEQKSAKKTQQPAAARG